MTSTKADEQQQEQQQEQQVPDTDALPDYTAENALVFWNARWDKNMTGWKVPERAAGTDEFATNLRGILKNPDLVLDPANPQAAYNDIHIFVPLCGDSQVVSFYFLCGFSVCGVDCNLGALQGACAEVAAGVAAAGEGLGEFEVTTTTIDASGATVADDAAAGDADFTKILGRLRPSSSTTQQQTNTLSLFCGDFFKFNARLAPQQGFALVADRGSGVAILPEQRAGYFALIKSLLTTNASSASAALFERVNSREQQEQAGGGADGGVRDARRPTAGVMFMFMNRLPDTRGTGPPFHYDVAEIEAFYRCGGGASAGAEGDFDIEVFVAPDAASTAYQSPPFAQECKAWVYKF